MTERFSNIVTENEITHHVKGSVDTLSFVFSHFNRVLQNIIKPRKSHRTKSDEY